MIHTIHLIVAIVAAAGLLILLLVLVVWLVYGALAMSDRPPGLAREPSTASTTPPPAGAWCRVCHGTRWWTERHQPEGWRCVTCYPSVHLTPEAIRREGEADA